MFWITMRQYMQERRETRSHSAVANMIAPLQVTVGTATGKVICHNNIIQNNYIT